MILHCDREKGSWVQALLNKFFGVKSVARRGMNGLIVVVKESKQVCCLPGGYLALISNEYRKIYGNSG